MRWGVRGGWPALLALPLLAIPHHSAQAADAAFAPTATVCGPNGALDKAKLADYLVSHYRISLDAMNHVPAQARGSGRAVLAALLKLPDDCAKQCSAEDSSGIGTIRALLGALKHGAFNAEYRVAGTFAESTFFDDQSTATVQCVQQAKTDAAPEKAKPSDNPFAQFRIRGNANDLMVGRDNPNAFKGTEKAAASLVNDSETHTRTGAVHGFLGYPLRHGSGNGASESLIGYVGANYSRMTVDGIYNAAKSTNTVNAGIAARIFRPSATWAQAFVFRPDYLIDYQDGSRIASLRAEYTPSQSYFNSFGPIHGGTFGKAIFSIPLDYGRYVRRKTGALPAEQPDFGHVGARVGFAVVSRDVPLELSAVYTALRAWRGDIDIHYLKTDLTLNLDQNNYFGLTLAYTRGQREDTFKRENQWKLQLTARY